MEVEECIDAGDDVVFAVMHVGDGAERGRRSTTRREVVDVARRQDRAAAVLFDQGEALKAVGLEE